MMPNIQRGGRMAGLMVYLAGPGRSNEHTQPHLVAGDDRVTFAVEAGKQLTNDDALDIANILDAPRKDHDAEVLASVREFDEEQDAYVTTGKKPAHVWHCSLALRPEEGELSSDQWGRIAEDFVTKMGFIDPDGAKSSRWAAVHHGSTKNGGDHIHIAVQMVREDGTKADVHYDFKRAQQACNELEKDYGLEVLESREHGRSISADKPAERARAERDGRPQSDREELRRRLRGALACSSDQGQYVQNLLDSGVRVAPRFATGGTEKVVGYKVALPPTANPDGSRRDTVWYAPSKLDSQLAWPRIQDRFGANGEDHAHQLLSGLKSGERPQPDRPSKLPNWSPEMLQKLQSGKTGPDTLANIYARVSMSVERDNPGVLHQLSNDHARLGQASSGGFHSARSAQRAFSKNKGTSWRAVLQMANRVARVTATNQALEQRSQWASQANSRLDSAEKILAAHGGEGPSSRTPGGQHGPQLGARPRVPGISRTRQNQDHDRGR